MPYLVVMRNHSCYNKLVFLIFALTINIQCYKPRLCLRCCLNVSYFQINITEATDKTEEHP